MKYSVFIKIVFFWSIWLPIACSGPTSTTEIIVFTSALGKDGDKFPVELSKLWEPITINLDSNSVEIAPNIKLVRIDLTEEKEFSILPTHSWLDSLIKPDPRVALRNIHNYLEQSKINGDFSNSQPINEIQLKANKEKYNKEIPLSFEVVSTKSSLLDANQFSSITDLLPELKKQIEKDNAAGASSLKYAIFYRLPNIAVGTQSSPPPPTQPPPEPTANCTITPTTAITQSNWYGVIEIGAKGIKPIAVHFEHNGQGKLQPNDFNNTFGTQDVTPKDEVSVPRVVQAVCETINQFHHLYGNLPVYLVGSSSMATVPHRTKLVAAIDKAVQLPVEFITADQEAGYLARGIWVPPLPIKRRCESAVIDIGSGNIKGGYLENCNPNVEKAEGEQFVSFDIQEFGTFAFSTRTQQKVDNKIFPSFIEAAKNTREELEQKIDEQVRTRPELTNGKERMYLVGGAVWMVNTLLCLDCPQYNGRPETHRDQDEYTVIRPADIEEFYRYVTQEGEKVCDFSQENPYLRRSMDGKYNTPWDESRIEKQKSEIQKVCKKFQAPRDLISAAEILRAVKNKMGISENRHIFFMQNNLYTWSRQYLIDKIQ